jgi:hypothetical protein
VTTGPEDGRNGTNAEHRSGPVQWPTNEGNRNSSDSRSAPEQGDIETDRIRTDTNKDERSDMPR